MHVRECHPEGAESKLHFDSRPKDLSGYVWRRFHSKYFLRRYFGTIIIGYLHSHFTWAWLRHSSIFDPLLPQETCFRKDLFIFTQETAKPLRFSLAERGAGGLPSI